MNRIRDLRESFGWTQTQLGRKIDAARNTVSGYETEDRQLTPALICKLCDIFGCTADYLLGRSDTMLSAVTDRQARILAAYDAAGERDRDIIDKILGLDVPESKRDTAAS